MLFISECNVVYYSISCWWWMGKRLIFDWIYRQMSNLIFQSWETFTKLIFCKRLMGLTFFWYVWKRKYIFQNLSKHNILKALLTDCIYSYLVFSCLQSTKNENNSSVQKHTILMKLQLIKIFISDTPLECVMKYKPF